MMFSFYSHRSSQLKHRQNPLERVLSVQAGIREPALFIVPLGQSPVVKRLLAVLDEEGNDIEPQALFQRDQPPDSAVAVLEGMDLLKCRVEGDDVLYRDLAFCVVSCVRVCSLIPIYSFESLIPSSLSCRSNAA